MNRARNRALAAAALTLMGVGALTGCAPATPEPAATGGASDPATPGTSDGPSSAADDAAEPAPTGPACLIGDWYIAEDQMQKFYTAISDTNSNLDINVEGGTGLSFSTDTYSYTPEFAIVLQVAGMESRGAITGSIDGKYSTTGETITTSQETSDIALTVTVAGTTIDGTDLADSLLASAPINSAPFDCGDAGPIIQFDTGDGNPRVPIQLTPAD